MDSIYAIVGGLGLRFVLSTITRSNSPLSDFTYKDDLSSTLSNISQASIASYKITSVLIGLWEGIVTLHFLKKMPNSYDPYIAYGVRLFIDLIVTESVERLVLVVIWTGLGVILADVVPAIWNEMGLHRLWRRTRRDLHTLTRMVEKSVPNVALSVPRMRVVRFTAEEQDREERRERRARHRQAEVDEEATSILQPPPSSTIESTLSSARRRVSPNASSELASILELRSSASSATATPIIAASSVSSREAERVRERERVKDRERPRIPVGLPTPSNTTATARPDRSLPITTYEAESEVAASPALSTSTNDLELDLDYDYELDDDNRSSSAASFTAASSPQFTSASNLTPRIDLLDPPSSNMMDYFGLPETSTPVPVYGTPSNQRLQFLDTAMEDAPEVDAEDELMSDIALEEEMRAIAGGSGKYDDDYEDGVATPRPRSALYLPPTPSDSAARFSLTGRRTIGRWELPPDESSLFGKDESEDEPVVAPPTASLEQIPDDEAEKAASAPVQKEEEKPERPPTPPAKDDLPASYRSPPPTAAAKLKSSSSRKAASAIGARPSEDKPKKSSKSKSVVSEGAKTPQLNSLKTQFQRERQSPPQEQPQPAISVSTSGLQVPQAPVGIAMITPISAENTLNNIPPQHLSTFGVPAPPPPPTPSLLGPFGNPGVPLLADVQDQDKQRGLPPAYADWTDMQDQDDEEDMYLDEETSRTHYESYKRAMQKADSAIHSQPQEPEQQHVFVAEPESVHLVKSPVADTPPYTPISPTTTYTKRDKSKEPSKDRHGRVGRGSIESKKTAPVKSLVDFWTASGDKPTSVGEGKSYSDVGALGRGVRRASGGISQVGNGSSGPIKLPSRRRTSASAAGGAMNGKSLEQQRMDDDAEAERVAAAAIASAEALLAQQQREDEEEREREEAKKRKLEQEAAEAEEQARLQKERDEAEAAEEAERQRLAQEAAEAEEARRAAEAEAERKRVKKEEKYRRKAEEQARKEAEEAEARRKAEEEEEARQKAEEEEEARRKEEEEEVRRKAAEEEEARRKAEEEVRRKAEEEETRRKAEEETRRKEEEEAAAEAKRLKEEKKKRQAEARTKKEAEEREAEEQKRKEEEVAELERKRHEEEEAERRAAEEVAEKERLRLEEERAKKEEDEKRLLQEKEEEEARLRKLQEEEQERQWKLEEEKRNKELAETEAKRIEEEEAKAKAAEEEEKRRIAEEQEEERKRKAAEEEEREEAAAEKAKPDLQNRDKALPPPPVADDEPPSVFGPGVSTEWNGTGFQQPASVFGNVGIDYVAYDDDLGDPFGLARPQEPTTPTQSTTNLAGIGAGGRSDLGREATGSPAPLIDVKPASANGNVVTPEDDANGEADEQDAEGDDIASVSAATVATEATEASADIEKRLQKTLSLRAQKIELEHRLKELREKLDPSAEEIKAAERVVRKYEKKIKRFYEDCKEQAFYYFDQVSASALLLERMSPEIAQSHINEALLWHITPEAQSFSFKITVPSTGRKSSAADKALKAAIVDYLDKLNIEPIADKSNNRFLTVAIDSGEFDEWIADRRQAITGNNGS